LRIVDHDEVSGTDQPVDFGEVVPSDALVMTTLGVCERTSVTSTPWSRL
jgi:hypothetical protein